MKKGAKCKKCGWEYTAYLFTKGNNNEQRGWTYEQFKCPHCGSTEKIEADIKYSKDTDGWASIGNLMK